MTPARGGKISRAFKAATIGTNENPRPQKYLWWTHHHPFAYLQIEEIWLVTCPYAYNILKKKSGFAHNQEDHYNEK